MAQVSSPSRRAAPPGATSPGRPRSEAAAAKPDDGKKGAPPSSYDYCPLEYVFHGAAVGEALHTYAVVVSASEPRPTRGTDYFMHMLLADATWGAAGAPPGRPPVRVNFFARDANALPRPRRPAGDIIRLHRARVSTWGDGGNRNLVARFGPGGGGWPVAPSAFVLFDGAAQGAVDPYQLSHETFSWDDDIEPVLLDMVRETAAQFIAPGPRPAPAARHDTPIARLGAAFALGTPPHTADLPAVRVLAVDAAAGVFWVWDGTDAKPWAPGTAALGVRVPPPPGEAARGAPLSPKSRSRLAAASAAGRFEPWSLLEGADLPKDLYGRLADRPLPAPGGGGGPPPAAAAAAPSPAASGGVRVLARIIAVHPQPSHAASACVRGPGGVWEFAVTLTLEDGTGRADVRAAGPDGGGLFAGVEPRDLGSAPSAAAAVRRRLEALLPPGGAEGGDGGAWAELGLRPGPPEPAPPAARKRPAPGAVPAAGPGGVLRVFGTAAATAGGAAAKPAGGRGKRGG